MTEYYNLDVIISAAHEKCFIEGELDVRSVVANSATTTADGKIYKVDHYNLKEIIFFVMKDMSVLQETPFTDQGSIVEIFTDLNVWAGIRKVIEQVNANALVA